MRTGLKSGLLWYGNFRKGYDNWVIFVIVVVLKIDNCMLDESKACLAFLRSLPQF